MRHITRCLNTQLSDICQRAIKLEELNAKVYRYLPDNLREQCHVGSFNNSCLTLVTTDPVWASQLRYALPDLRDKLRSEAGIHQLASIKVVVSMHQNATINKPSVAPVLSEKACEILRSAAEQFTYTPLKEALKRLI